VSPRDECVFEAPKVWMVVENRVGREVLERVAHEAIVQNKGQNSAASHEENVNRGELGFQFRLLNRCFRR